MIGIIGAMDSELEILKSTAENTETFTFSGIDYVKGTIYGKDVVIAKCGIGKVSAALCAQGMILKFAPDVVINTGVGGSLDSEVNIGDVVIADKCVQYDMDTSEIGDEIGLISGINLVHIPCCEKIGKNIINYCKDTTLNLKMGTIASADRFLTDMDEKMRIKKMFGAIACDMESGSIAQVCYVNKVDCVIIRSISDGFGKNSAMEYTKFTKLASKNSCTVTLKLIENR